MVGGGGEARVGRGGPAIRRTRWHQRQHGDIFNLSLPKVPWSGSSSVDESDLHDVLRVRQAGAEHSDALSALRIRVPRQAGRAEGLDVGLVAARAAAGGGG